VPYGVVRLSQDLFSVSDPAQKSQTPLDVIKNRGNADREEDGFMITRMIFVNVPADKAGEAVKLWKEECAPLMIKQPGCLSEELLRGRENSGEFISVSTWEDQLAIDLYRKSEAHSTIQKHARTLANVAKVDVKTYEVLG
jgi:quinol monooxygenase YgiN